VFVFGFLFASLLPLFVVAIVVPFCLFLYPPPLFIPGWDTYKQEMWQKVINWKTGCKSVQREYRNGLRKTTYSYMKIKLPKIKD